MTVTAPQSPADAGPGIGGSRAGIAVEPEATLAGRPGPVRSVGPDGSADDPVRGGPEAVGPPMDAAEERRLLAIRDLRRLRAAARELRATLVHAESLYDASLARLEAGVDVGRSLTGVDVSGARTSVVDALSEFERSRHLARGTFISGQHAEGSNMKEIGRVWGISRQLAHRFLKEARRDA